MSIYARMLHDWLRRQPAWDGPGRVVVGHSFGGMLALQWLLDYGSSAAARIDGLVLVSTTAGPVGDRLGIRLSVGRAAWRVPAKRLLWWWNTPLVTRQVKRWLSDGVLDARPVDFQTLPVTTDWAVDAAGWRNTDWRAMRSFRLAAERYAVGPELHRVRCPTVVLHGTRDALFSLSAAEELAALLPHGTLHVVAGAGHALPLTHGWALQDAVDALLGDRPAPAPRPSGPAEDAEGQSEARHPPEPHHPEPRAGTGERDAVQHDRA